MRCSKCNHNNPEGMSFCGRCGSVLVKRCTKCYAENSLESRFCGTCASPLSEVAAQPVFGSIKLSTAPPSVTALTGEGQTLQAERKTVTALFADLDGSTALIENLDPDDARALIDPALELMIDVVRRYDGYVVQSTGDGIFALFGAPIAHEDHPQRAVYAALEMQAALRKSAAKAKDENLKAVAARVGVNTGEVVVRTIQSGDHYEYTPVGLTAHLAARIQTVTPPGSVGLGETTRTLVEGFFELEPMGSYQLKGISEPVRIYKAVDLSSLRTRFQVATRRGLAQLVGRDSELSQLRAAFAETLRATGKIVSIVGEAGAGKSRLIYEFKAKLPDDCAVLETSSSLHIRASAFQPLVEILHERYHIEAADAASLRRQKLKDALTSLDPALSDALPYLFGLLGVQDIPDPLSHMDADIRRRRTFDALYCIFLRESLKQPLVIILEDLQWIDPDSNAFLNHLVENIAGVRILLLISSRPEYRHTWAGNYTQLRLAPLSSDNALELLTRIVGSAAELAPLKQLIVQRAEGNPLFIEEIVRSLLEQGTLARTTSARLDKPLLDIKVPHSIK